MKKIYAIAALFGVVSAMALGTTAASAAEPAPILPPTQALFNVDCNGPTSPQLWSFDTDGSSTPVGSSGIDADCANGAQTSPVDGKSYFIATSFPAAELATIDLTTGVATVIAPITGDTDNPWQLVITNHDGAFVTFNNDLYSIDLTTATTKLIGSMGAFVSGAVGYDFLTDTIYGFSRSNNVAVFTIDRLTGAATNTGLSGSWPSAVCLYNGLTSELEPDNVAFDANGIAWIQADGCDSNVMPFDPATGLLWVTGELFDSTGTIYTAAPFDYYSETFIISNVPQYVAPAVLAKTGVDYTVAASVGGSAALLALAGTMLVLWRRRTRTS